MAELLLLLLLVIAPAAAAPTTVVTFDNGGFNTPLYTPRWNGRWRQPSAAQEVAQSVARVLHANPQVYAYAPPGREPARPGEVTPVPPIAPGCSAPVDDPTDPCWCGPASNCWGALGPNYHPSTSTSLYLSVATLRSALADAGPRVEVHVTDLFEEDPATADDPRNSDRCVTEAGVRRALSAVMNPTESESLDHLAVGLMRATIDPPPPGGSWGNLYALELDDGACYTGRRVGEWSNGRGTMTMTMAVLVLGFDTAADDAQVTNLVDGLEAQLNTDRFELDMVWLRDPARVLEVGAPVVSPSDVAPWVVPSPGSSPGVPCDEVTGTATFTSAGLPVPVERVVGRCDGYTEVHFERRGIVGTFLQQAGLDPSRDAIQLAGTVTLTGGPDAIRGALEQAEALNGSGRPLPLWGAVVDAAGLSGAEGPWTPWETRVEVQALRVTDLDSRPWLLLIVGSVSLGLAVGATVATVLRQLHATRAMRLHWDRSVAPGEDPLRVRPLAMVIAAAQEEVDRQWAIRGTVGGLTGVVTVMLSMWLLLQLYRVVVG